MKSTLAILASALAAGAVAAPVCSVHSGSTAPAVVELYTSEGCSSCPPADRWLSTLKGRDDVLTLAFHVDYWDRLGWVDRFASRDNTERQYQLSRWSGSAQVYTPQVVVNGRDSRAGVALPNAAASPVAVSLQREGERVTATIAPSAAAPRLDGYWAVLEDNHQSKVRAGENAGETLKHDSVVRLYKPVPAWAGSAGTQAQLSVSAGVATNPRRVVFVVTDAATHKPLQALALGC